MRQRLIPPVAALLLAVAVLATIAIADVRGQPVRADTRTGDYMAGQLIVHFDDGSASPYATVAAVSGASVKLMSSNGAFAAVSVPVGSEDGYASQLAALDGVSAVERNPLSQPAFVPNDEFYPDQWNLPMIQAEEAWDITMGEGVTVAVLDTGVAFEDFEEFGQAPDLADTIFVDPYDATVGDDRPFDENGHGTHVAGTLAQSTNNGIGTAGVAPAVTVIPVKVCVFLGCPGSAIADGIIWAVDHDADIINMSLGGDTISLAERDALAYAEENGVLVVAAAGNGGSDQIGDPFLDYPAAVDTVFSVGALRQDQTLAPYSNFGLGDSAGIDIVAPGGDTHVDQDGDGNVDGILQNTFAFTCGAGSSIFDSFAYCYYQGTSMATPHVSGTAALLLSEHPDMTLDDLREVLRCSALDLGDEGYDETFGAGLVQAADALSDSDFDGTVDCLDSTVDLPPSLLKIQSATAGVDQSAAVSLNAEVAAPGLSAFSVDIVFDPTIVELVTCEPLVFAVCNPEVTPGLARVSGIAIPSLVGPATLADLTFQAIGEVGSSSSLDLQLIDFADDALDDLKPVTVVIDGEIAIASDIPEDAADPLPGPSGDADCDFDVDVVDALFVLRFAASLAEPTCVAAADVDCDGDTDAVDALKITRHVAGLAVALPEACVPIGSVG